MATETPSNKPANSVNATKNQKAASQTQLTVSVRDTLMSSLTSHSASIDVLSLLRTPEGRKKWIDSIYLGMQNTSFNSTDIDEDFKKKLAQNILAQAEKLTYIASRERAQILTDIERAYHVTQGEKESILRQLQDTSRINLASYRTVSGRTKFLRTVTDLTTFPLLKSATYRVSSIIGNDWATCTSETQATLVKWYNGEILGNTEITNALKGLSGISREAVLALITDGMRDWTLEKVSAINPDEISKELLIENAQISLREKIETAQWELLSGQRMSSIEIDEAVQSMGWTDIKETRLNASEILSILEKQITPFIFEKKAAENFADQLQRDFVRSAPNRKAIYAAQSNGRVRNISEAQKQAEKYETSDKFDDGTIAKIEQDYRNAGGTIIGAKNMLDAEFTSGRRALILRVTQSDGSERFIRIKANRQGLNPDQSIPIILKASILGGKSSKAWAEPEIFDVPKSGVFFTDTFPRAIAGGIRSIEIVSEAEQKDYLKSIRAELEAQYDAAVTHSKIPEKDTDAILKENAETGISLSRALEGSPAPVDWVSSNLSNSADVSSSTIVAAGSGGTGWVVPPNGIDSGIEDPEEENDDEINTIHAGNTEIITDSVENSNTIAPVETAVETPPNTQTEFESRIGALGKGTKWPLVEGNYLILGKEWTKGFNIFRIHRIDPVLGLQFTDGLGTLEPTGGEYYGYDTLFSNLFAKRGVTAQMSDAGLSSPEDLLDFMQEKSGVDAWKDMKIHENTIDWSKFFDFRDREFDTAHVAKKYFIAPDGKILEIHAIDGDQIIARLGKDFVQSTSPDEANTASWYEEPQVYSVQFIAGYLMRSGAVPWNKPDREINSRAVEDATKPGTLRAVMGKLSFHDIMAGGTKFFEEFKHHLEHGNHLQEQRVMLGIAQKMGMKSWNVEWYYDFKTKYENEEKKLIEDRIEVLGKMASPDRQKSIRNSLLTDGTHDYDHWTNAIAMLQKHGNLYAWELQDLEGSWIFFKRIANIPLKGNVADYKEFQETVAKIKRKGIDNITEEAVIEEYMKTDSHFPNSQIWKMVKWKLKAGVDEEMENGEKEAKGFLTLDQKLNYAMGKLKGKEYAHGIGAFKQVMESKGSNKKRQSFAFALAMSRIPERLPREVLKELVDMFEKGQIHSPALNFVKERSDQSLFRGVIEDLVELKAATLDADWASAIRESYSKAWKAIKVDTDTRNTDGIRFDAKAIGAIESFWNQYGEFLQSELTMKSNAENGFIRDASKRSTKPRLQQYWSRISGHLGDANIMEETQVGIGTSFMQGADGASPLMIRPDKIFDKIGLANSMGRQESSTLYDALQEDFFLSLDEYRWKNTDESGSPIGASEDDQKEYFTLLYSAFAKKMETIDFGSWMRSPLGIEFTSIGLEAPKKIGNTVYLIEKSRIEKLLNEVTNKLGPKDIELRTLSRSPTVANQDRRTLLNAEVNWERAKQAQYNRMLSELEQGNKNQVGRMNLADPDQKIHFEECFKRFYTKHTVDEITRNTSKWVQNVTDNSEGNQWNTPVSNIPLTSTELQS